MGSGEASVLVGSDDGTVYDLDQATGRLNWSHRVAAAVHSSPAVDTGAGLVLGGDASGAVTALSLSDGHSVWSRPTSGPVTVSVSLANGMAFVGSGGGSVYSLSKSTGTIAWSTSMPAAVTTSGALLAYPQLKPSVYVVGSTDGTLDYSTCPPAQWPAPPL